MIETPGFFWTILFFLLAIGPLVFVHEMGHYLVGRWCGVKAEVFSIGFGREITGWTDKRGTRWKIGWMPLGGYVRFAGDMSATSEPSDELTLHVFGGSEGIRLIALLDNLGKGASGAAVQSLNLMAGLDETAGLRL